MKKSWLILTIALLAVTFTGFTLAAAAGGGAISLPVCLPGVPDPTMNCVMPGPEIFRQELAENNLVYPLTPLPSIAPDESLVYLPYYYARVAPENVNLVNARVFGSLDAAIKGSNDLVKRTIRSGFNYLSYIDVHIAENGHKYYMISPGEWVRGGELIGNIATSRFQGLEFTETPENIFGWMLLSDYSYKQPGFIPEVRSTHYYYRFEVIQVYDEVEIDGMTWFMIGRDEWVNRLQVSLVIPNPNPPGAVDDGRWIEINLYEQTVSIYENNTLRFATLTSTGVFGYWTRPGLFQIFEKVESTPMSGSFEADYSDYYYLEDVPYTMYFDESRALHGAYWHSKLGYTQSHGCVNLSPGDSHWLFNWATVGDWVYVWDPSGETPEDPALYGSGGA